MGAPDKNYRENPDRAIYVSGQINFDLVQRLTPAILKYRCVNCDPITVYIDSPGGNVRLSEVISGLLKTPTADDQQCRVITVATGHAHSAAADLLASGDYAIAYPKAIIHYHGVRQEVEQGVTMETATSLADSLRETNDQFAIRLATRSIERFMLLFLYLRSSEFEDIQKKSEKQLDPVELFARALKGKVSAHFRIVIDAALKRFRECEALDKYVWANLKIDREKDSVAKVECDMLKLILDYELSRSASYWSLSQGGLLKIAEDFTLLNDFNFGNQRFIFPSIVERWKQYFLTTEEMSSLMEAEAKKDEKTIRDIRGILESRMQPIWYFVFSICQNLQQKENQLTASEAYWLGIVDEVLGQQTPCLRLMVEQGASSPSSGQTTS